MKTTLKSWAEIVIESVNYIIISYALSCMTFLFRIDWLFILFFASEIWLLSKYFATLNKLTKSKIVSGAVWVCSLIIVGFLKTRFPMNKVEPPVIRRLVCFKEEEGVYSPSARKSAGFMGSS